jgi:hypothetical protein
MASTEKPLLPPAKSQGASSPREIGLTTGGSMVIKKSAGVLAIGALVPPLLFSACGSSTTTAPASQAPPAASASPTSTPATSASPKNVTEKDFNAANFPAAPKVDNRWYPLTRGTQYTLQGEADRGKGTRPHQVVFTVTDLVKVINGVPTVVLWDRDINEGELEEAELAFQSQDNDGNVWLLGEYPEEYEDGEFQGAEDTWISGLDGAKPGVLMRADPRPGTSSYLQGLAPKIEFQDRAKVSKTGLRTCVPVQCYDDVLLIDEWNPLEPEDGHQLKYFARDVGNVRVGAVDDPEGEELVLVKVTQLNGTDLAKARSEALKLERHAFQVSTKLYGRTSPATQGQ